MTEEKIKELLNKEYLLDLEKELIEIFPNGFDINKIDKRIKNKIEELANKYDSIEKPIQERKQK
jgi:hypothetical protein